MVNFYEFLKTWSHFLKGQKLLKMPKIENSNVTFWFLYEFFSHSIDFWRSVFCSSTTWGYEEVQVFSPSPKWMNNGDCKLEMHFVAESFWAGDLASSCGQSVVKFKSWKTLYFLKLDYFALWIIVDVQTAFKEWIDKWMN